MDKPQSPLPWAVKAVANPPDWWVVDATGCVVASGLWEKDAAFIVAQANLEDP